MIESRHAIVSLGPAMGAKSPPSIARYGPMKVGDRDALNEYADLLADHAARELSQNEDQGKDWLIASPPTHSLPAAANVLAELVSERLESLQPEVQVAITELRRQPLGVLLLESHYGSRTNDERQDYLARTETGWSANDDLQGANVLFFNDVRITGAQEDRTRIFLHRKGVEEVRWRYVCALDPPASGTDARQEAALNLIGMATDAELSAHISTSNFIITTGLVWRLLSLSEAALAAALEQLPTSRKEELGRLLAAERAPVSGVLGRHADALRLAPGVDPAL